MRLQSSVPGLLAHPYRVMMVLRIALFLNPPLCLWRVKLIRSADKCKSGASSSSSGLAPLE